MDGGIHQSSTFADFETYTVVKTVMTSTADNMSQGEAGLRTDDGTAADRPGFWRIWLWTMLLAALVDMAAASGDRQSGGAR